MYIQTKLIVSTKEKDFVEDLNSFLDILKSDGIVVKGIRYQHSNLVASDDSTQDTYSALVMYNVE